MHAHARRLAGVFCGFIQRGIYGWVLNILASPAFAPSTWSRRLRTA